jgi:putative ABC transport system permease protein
VLFPAEAEAIVEACPSVAQAVPAVVKAFRVRFDGRSAETSVLGIPPAGLALRNVRLAEGRGFEDDEDRTAQRVAVIGPSVAEALFAGSDPIGRRLQVGRVPFEVVGVAARRGLDAEGSDQDDVVIVPLGAALRRLLNQTHVHAIYVQAKGSGAVAQAELEVRELLRSRRRSAAREDAVRVQDPARLLATERRAAQALSRWIAAGSAAALAVGGVGVMAVMLLSLRERTREVGLRRALGARRRDVLAEFLFESSLLSAAGGLAGLLLGAGATALLGRLPGWAASFSWPAAAAGLGFSIAVGLVFGLFPALRASRLEPIAALRGE